MEGGVLVLGGGISGLTLSTELKKLGIEACVIEKSSSLGGKVSDYCCKATDVCNRCFVCVGDKIKDTFLSSDIEYFTEAELLFISRDNGGFRAEFVGKRFGKESVREERSFKAVSVAVGFTPFDAKNFKKEYGYGIWDGVITSVDLERILREDGDIGSDVKKVAFIQCVGSRDKVSGNFYCSRVCCGYSLRMADLLLHNDPEREVFFFYMDIQPLWKGFGDFLERVRSKGIKVVRSIPSKVYGFKGERTVILRVPENGSLVDMEFDCVVLSVGITPSAELVDLSKNLSLERDRWGFVSSSPPGVFPVGTVLGPMDIMGSIRSARGAALEIVNYLGAWDD